MSVGAAARELVDMNIMTEFIALKKRIDTHSAYDQARYLVLDCIVTCVLKDRDQGDYIDDEIIQKLRKAGSILNDHEDMNDPLIWSFIPRRYYGMFNHFWDGIGSWRA